MVGVEVGERAWRCRGGILVAYSTGMQTYQDFQELQCFNYVGGSDAGRSTDFFDTDLSMARWRKLAT